MPFVYVCPLSKVSETVAAANASHLISLINDDAAIVRPASIREENHLHLGINDIVEPLDGKVLPAEVHMGQLLAFIDGWDQTRPIVVHCLAGISRSTAAAFITLCVARPDRDEREIAAAIRQASRFATPNARLVALADAMLARNGRMIAAITAIGRGEVAFESVPFVVPVGD
jgi:predicted protein tyrosine phosphatase